jgi:hypothetical protein
MTILVRRVLLSIILYFFSIGRLNLRKSPFGVFFLNIFKLSKYEKAIEFTLLGLVKLYSEGPIWDLTIPSSGSLNM